MNIENDKKESSIKEIKIDSNNNSKNKYINVENNKYTLKKFKKYNNTEYNQNKPPSRNTGPCSTLDSNLNLYNTNYNSLNKSIIISNQSFSSFNQNDIKNKFKDSKYTFEELNRKFHTLKIEQKRREKSLVFYRNKSINKNKINNNKKLSNKIRRAFSYSNLSSNLENYLNNNKKETLNKNICNSFYNKNINNKYEKFFSKKANKIDMLKLKINSMIDNFDKESTQNKKPKINNYKGMNKYSLFNNYKNSKPKGLSFLNTKDNDINKYNIFAKSKLMDINDIKKINNNNSFYDINYNRGYNKIFNKKNKNLDNTNLISNVVKEQLLLF